MSQALEALRQQTLLRSLLRDASPDALVPWVKPQAQWRRGWQAYQANAQAIAERALASAYPALQALLGEQSFALLARDFWQRCPPHRGDLGRWGEELAAFVAAAPDLAQEPYLPDVARLEWAVHVASFAADSTAAQYGLEHLAEDDPAALCLAPQAGTRLIASAYPVVSIWLAHQPSAEGSPSTADLFAAARQAMAEGRGETALVWRRHWAVQVAPLEPQEARLIEHVLSGLSLAHAVQATADAGPLDFEAWLLVQLRRGWLAGVNPAHSAALQPTQTR